MNSKEFFRSGTKDTAMSTEFTEVALITFLSIITPPDFEYRNWHLLYSSITMEPPGTYPHSVGRRENDLVERRSFMNFHPPQNYVPIEAQRHSSLIPPHPSHPPHRSFSTGDIRRKPSAAPLDEVVRALSNNNLKNESKVPEFGQKFKRTFSKLFDRNNNRLDRRRISNSIQEKETQNEEFTVEVLEEHETKNAIQPERNAVQSEKNVVDNIVEDFTTGDKKILRAIGRTATVNAAVLATVLTGGAGLSAVAGAVTGGAITAKRFGDGIANEDEKEVVKSLAVYGSATAASITGQVVTGAILIGATGVALPVVGAVAFGVGCVGGIAAGALSEWGVDSVLKKENDAAVSENDESVIPQNDSGAESIESSPEESTQCDPRLENKEAETQFQYKPASTPPAANWYQRRQPSNSQLVQ